MNIDWPTVISSLALNGMAGLAACYWIRHIIETLRESNAELRRQLSAAQEMHAAGVRQAIADLEARLDAHENSAAAESTAQARLDERIRMLGPQLMELSGKLDVTAERMTAACENLKELRKWVGDLNHDFRDHERDRALHH